MNVQDNFARLTITKQVPQGLKYAINQFATRVPSKLVLINGKMLLGVEKGRADNHVLRD